MQAQPGTQNGSIRRTPADWVEASIDSLLEDDLAGLQVKRLAKRLSVTPGSFYWHFRSRDHLRDQVLRHWRDLLRGAAAAAEAAGSGAQKIEALPAILRQRRLPALDEAMRRWGQEDPVVAAEVIRADELRMRVIASLLKEAGVEAERADQRAKVAMWAFRGSGDADAGERFRAIADLFDN